MLILLEVVFKGLNIGLYFQGLELISTQMLGGGQKSIGGLFIGDCIGVGVCMFPGLFGHALIRGIVDLIGED